MPEKLFGVNTIPFIIMTAVFLTFMWFKRKDI